MTDVPAWSPELVAGVGGVGEPRWAPDGRRLAWIRTGDAVSELVVDGTPVSEPRPRTGGAAFAWAGPDRLVVAADAELWNVGVADPGGATRFLRATGQFVAPAVCAGRVAVVHDTDDACVVVVVGLGGGAPRVVSSGDFAWDPAWSPDGRLLAWHEWDDPAMPWDGSRIVVAASDGSDRVVVAGGPEESVGQPRFAPAGPARLAFVSDRGGWVNVTVTAPDGAACRVPVAERHEHAEPSWSPGQRSFAWSTDGHSIAICRNEDGFGRLVVVPVGGGPVVEWSRGWHRDLDWGPQGLVATRSGARTPPQVVVFGETPHEGAPTRRTVDRALGTNALPVDTHVEPRPVEWPAADGATVRGLWYPVPGAAATDRPLLVLLHGGPTDQARVDWSPRTQYWLARGWSVLTPNPRGSTGSGRAYAQALRGEWGALDVDDVIAGLRAVGVRGWGDPRRLALVGGSAGGFVALLAAVRAPELVRAVAVSYPVTDLEVLAEQTHRFERHACDTLVGPRPAAAERYRDRSPHTHADALRVPTLVLQGDADPVVPAAAVRAFCDAVRAAGGDVELCVYPGEGHGWRQPATVADALRRTEAFLARKVLDR